MRYINCMNGTGMKKNTAEKPNLNSLTQTE